MSWRTAPWRWALAVWTLGIWASRVRNAIADDDLDAAARTSAIVIAVAFVAGGAALAFTLWRPHQLHAIVVDLLVAAGIIRWSIRGPLILASDEWDAGFKVVHTGLWLVTVALSVMAWRELRSSHGSARHRH
ncbi:MAG: hypothetical protein HKN94_02585 [Acidimicrobiales bacterium]|nr:hypothetical protein [Acidimicrobiales bacterium]RZV47195.1 MAG: hypothetical protein EX269_05450 [Acidimicrobiales bacterium]